MTMVPAAWSDETTYEFTVLGPLGPVLRAAFPGHRFATVEPCTVVHLHDCADRDLVDLVELFESAGVVVQGMCRLSAHPGPEFASAPPDVDPRPA